jgi:diguanylate cyclase
MHTGTDAAARVAAPRPHRADWWLVAVTVAALAVFTLSTLLRTPGQSLWWADYVLYDLIYAGAALSCLSRARRHPAQRGAWLALGGSLAVTICGDVYYSWLDARDVTIPYPSWADLFYLLFFPAAFVGVALLIRARVPRFLPSMWLDGLVAGFGLAALAYTLAFDDLVGFWGEPPLATVVNLAYPVGDLVLIVMLSAAVVMVGKLADRTWWLLVSGLVCYAVADVTYALLLAVGSYRVGGFLDACWPAAATLIGLAAVTSPHEAAHRAPRWWSQVLIPGTMAAGALGLLVYGQREQLPLLAVGLAVATLLTASARVALTWREVAGVAEVRRQARTDELTGLLNRRAFGTELEHALEQRGPKKMVSVLMFDLDRFKEVNDALGHGVGDLLLTLIGPRVAGALRDGDVLARLGGDEFAVILSGHTDPEVASVVAERIIRSLSSPFDLPEISLHIGASIGMASCPDHADDAAVLMRQADVAMYDAKAAGGGHRVYNPANDQHSRDRLQTIEQLRGAIVRGELVLHYQPQIDLADGSVHGVEALARWNHPELGILTPDRFLALAEQAGLMRPFTQHVLEQALRQLGAWRENGLDLGVAVNISVSNLLDVDLLVQVGNALERHGVPPDRLCLEITETTLMADPSRARQILAALHERGVRVAVDDYGTGYSSLAYLRDLAVHELKLDRGFISNVWVDDRASAIVRSTVDLAHSLGLSLVAEGVEDEKSARLLEMFGCDVAQGYHYSRPLPPEELEDWVRLHSHATKR